MCWFQQHITSSHVEIQQHKACQSRMMHLRHKQQQPIPFVELKDSAERPASSAGNYYVQHSRKQQLQCC
jgi:hypothetical protein